MPHDERHFGRNDHLQRLPPEYYRGQAYVHWTMTMEDRRVGWLNPVFHARLREILVHTGARHGIACPIYCCMPDHLHVLWIGSSADADQLLAARFFRKQLNLILEERGFRLQREGYDHVLTEQERERSAFENVAEYIARNPERAKLVRPDAFREYPYTDGLVPGYPELHFRQPDYWERFWRIYASMLKSRGVS